MSNLKDRVLGPTGFSHAGNAVVEQRSVESLAAEVANLRKRLKQGDKLRQKQANTDRIKLVDKVQVLERQVKELRITNDRLVQENDKLVGEKAQLLKEMETKEAPKVTKKKKTTKAK